MGRGTACRDSTVDRKGGSSAGGTGRTVLLAGVDGHRPAIMWKVIGHEYDLSVVVQVEIPVGWMPKEVIEALCVAIRGDLGSRYYRKGERGTHCVVVSCAEMHLDLTPLERRFYTPEREGGIFHDREGIGGPMRRCIGDALPKCGRWTRRRGSRRVWKPAAADVGESRNRLDEKRGCPTMPARLRSAPPELSMKVAGDGGAGA